MTRNLKLVLVVVLFALACAGWIIYRVVCALAHIAGRMR